MEERSYYDAVGGVIKLVSSDGLAFYVEKCIADVSQNLRVGLGIQSEESETKTFTFPNIRGDVMEKVIQYLHYKYKHQQLLDTDVIKMNQVPKFEIPPEMGLDVLCAATYLQC